MKPAEAKPAAPAAPAAKPPEPTPAKPAEAKPPEAKPAEAKPAVPAKPAPSYVLLARPAVADRLKLSDEQRAKVAALLVERREASAKAAEADRAKVFEENEKKLAALLSEAQQADFAKIPVEPLLKFKFRFQRWVDVLEEVARQAGLSLVLDAPPPGTLNYSDDKEYTPTEAIDLMNSVLLTKGFTLIRRDRMLVCVNIEEGIPENLVPQVTLDELEHRGRFELVKVMFPLKGRPAATVADEIKPLMSPLGKAVPLPSTGQILVSDSAGNIKAIRAMIETVPAAAAAPVAAPVKTEPPVFAIYQIKEIDPQSALSVLKTLYPAPTNFVLDPKTDQLSVHAGPTVQASVKAILEEMTKKGQPPEKQSRLELYAVEEAKGAQIVKSLEGITPKALLTLDAKGGRIVAWATGAEHELLKKALEKLGMAPLADQARQFEVYRLTKADPKTTLAMLEALLPTARLAVDAPTNSLVAIASAADQKAIKALLEQLQPVKPGPDTPELRFYALTHTPTTSMATVLEGLVPKAKVTIDAVHKRLMVVASAADHEAMKKAVEQFEKGAPPEEKNKLVNYPVTQAQRKRFQAIATALTTELPGIQVITDAEPGELAIWAKPEQHKVIAEILEQLKREVPAAEKHVLAAYPLTSADPTSVTTVLKSMFPSLQVTLDPKSNRLLVWALPADQDAFKKTIDQLQTQVPADKLPRFETYLLYGAEPTALTANLQTLAPNAKFTTDTKAGRLVVWATPAEHEVLRGAMEKLGRGTSIENTTQVETHRLTRVDPTTLVPLLQSLVPEAKVSVDTTTKTLVVVAVPADQQTVRGVVRQFQPEKTGRDDQERFEVYPVHGADPSTLVTQLQTLVPGAKLVADTKAGRIVAWGTGADHDALKVALEKLVRGAAPDGAPRLEVYRLTKADATTLTPLLQTLVPDAKISVDTQTKSLIAVAVPADHLTIKTVLEQLQPEKPAADAPQLRFYPLTQLLPASVVTVLQKLAPKAEITLEPGGKRLTVVASPEDHRIVKAAIEQIQTVSVLDEKNKLVTYPVTPGQKKRFQSVATSLTTELPGMQIIAETEPGELAVWAKPTQHVVISEILDQLKREVPAGEKYLLVAYAIKAADPQNVLTVMKTLFPNAQFVLDARTRRLIVWTLPADQEAIKAALEKIDTGTAAEGQDKLMVYPVPDIDPATAVKVLQEQLPDAKISTDTKSGAILAWARTAEHQIIARTLKQLKVEPDADHKETLVAYPLTGGDATAISTVLKTLVPKAQVVVETKTNSIMATAVPKDHELIRSAIEQVSKKGLAGGAPEMVVHNLPSLGASGAASLIPTLKQIFPDATFAAGADATKLVVWARPADQEPIRKAIDEMAKKEPPEIAHKLVVYTVDRSGPAAGPGMLTVLRALFPDASMGYGSDPNRLFVWARPAEHPAIKNTIDEMAKKEPAENAHRLVVFTLDKHGPGGAAGVMTVLQTMFPQIQLTAGAEPDQLVAWVQPSQEKQIREALKTLAIPETPDKARKMVVYTLEASGTAGVSGAITILTTMFPEAKFNAGTEPNKLVAWARPAEHEKIKAAIGELARKEPAKTAPRMVVYTLESTASGAVSSAISVLTLLFPEAKFNAGAEPNKIVAWARPAEHKKIKAAIDELSAKEPPEKAHRMVVYALETAGAATASGAMTILTTMFPEAKFAAGTEPNKIVAWARPDDQKKIAAAVAELGKKEAPETARKMVVYPYKSADSSSSYYTVAALRTMFPDALFSVGADYGKIAVWARPTEQEAIKIAIEQLSQEDPPEKAHKLVIYTLETTGAGGMTGAISILTSMFPDAKFTAGSEPDKVAVWARPPDHKRIEAAVKELSSKEPPEKARQMVVYALETAGAATASGAMTILTTMFPEAKFAAGTEPNKIVAWARPDDQKKIAAAVAELGKKEAPETARKMVVYPYKSADSSASYYTLAALRTMFPDALFSVGADYGKIAVWARPTEQEAIKTAIEQLSQEDPPEKAHKLVIYTLETTGAGGMTGAISILTSMFPDAKFTAGSEPDKVAVWARPPDHKRVEAAVKELSSKEPPEKARQMVVYALETTGPYGATGAMTILTTMFPEAKFAAGTEPNKIVAWARPDDQKKIAAAVAELGKKEAPETARKMVVYPYKSADSSASYYTLAALRTMFPDALFSVGADHGKIAVWARPTEQEAIKSAIEQLSQDDPPEKAHRMAVYTLEGTGTAGVTGPIGILTSMFPDAKITAGSEPDQIVAWARPVDQERIKSAVAELAKKAPPEKARKIVVYPFKSARPRAAYYTINVLREMFPDAMFSIGAEPDKLVVWARPAEHATIKTTVEQLSQEDPPERAFRLGAYTLESAGTTSTSAAITLLTSMFPEAHFTAGTELGKVVAWARPDDHAKIKAAVEELGKKEPPEKAAQAAVYQLNSMMATPAISFLTTAFPEAQFSAGAEPHTLIVWARPDDQKQIQATIEKLDVEGAAQLQRTVSVYPLTNGDARSLTQLLEPMTRRNVQFVTDSVRNRLIVWADAKQQDQVRATVEQFQKENAKIGEPTTQVYRFQRAEPQAAQTVLAGLTPAAQIALDTTTHSLVVTATPDDHAKIKSAIDEIDRRDEKGQAPRLQVHRVTTADPTNLLTVLQGLFRARSDVQLSLDEHNDAIVAVASPAQHETIQNLIDQLEKEAKADSASRLQLYALKDADPDSTLSVLTDLMAKQGIKAKISIDTRGNQLVVIARPEHQATVQKALEQMQGEERIFEIFTLEVVDPWTAETAIGRLFGDGGTYFSASGPSVDVDPTSQQLFVRATKEQLTKIRQLLVKLGETGLGATAEGDVRRSRTVSFDGDLSVALDEIQRVWPQLRKNPIHVMKPASDIPIQGRAPKPPKKPEEPRIRPAAGPKPPTAEVPRNEAMPPPGDSGWRPVKAAADSDGWRASRPKVAEGQDRFPVIVIPGDGTVTIASDDPAALAQFEDLLRSLSRQRGTVGRNFSVFLLRNAKATEVAQTLQQVFRGTATGWRSMSGPVVFVPDARLNAIGAYASRADRATIEGLIKVLDTADLPESMSADRMHMIPVKNTNAARLEQTLRDLFHGQVESLSVEPTTNSLVVMGSEALVEEISRVIKTLDQAAGSDSSRNVSIVPLKKASSERVQKALDVILKSGNGRRSR